MKLPGYLQFEKLTPGPGEFEVTVWVRFRPQHPDMLRELWRMMRVRPFYLKPVVVPMAWWGLCRRRWAS